MLTIEAWFIAACTNRKSPVRPSSVEASVCRSECADFPAIPAAASQAESRRCACRIETRRSSARNSGPSVRPEMNALSRFATDGDNTAVVGLSFFAVREVEVGDVEGQRAADSDASAEE